MAPRKRPLAPTQCLEEAPTAKSIRLGGRFISLTQLSTYGMDTGYLSYILAGERMPSVKYGKKIARCLGIFNDDGEPDLEGLLKLIKERVKTFDTDLQHRITSPNVR